MTLTYEAAARELTTLYGNGGRISAGILAAIGSLSDANQPGGIEGQIAHLIACTIDDVKVHEGKLGPRTILAEDRLKVLIRLAVKSSATTDEPSTQPADAQCKCRRLGDWDGSTHHPLCDDAPGSDPVDHAEQPTSQFDNPRVQAVYSILCGDDDPPMSEHWEGWVSRRIVDALRPMFAEVAAQVCEGVVVQSNNSLFRSGAKICAGEIRRAADAQPAATLPDDVLMQAIADTTARGHVWASRALSDFRAKQKKEAAR